MLLFRRWWRGRCHIQIKARPQNGVRCLEDKASKNFRASCPDLETTPPTFYTGSRRFYCYLFYIYENESGFEMALSLALIAQSGLRSEQ